MHDQVVCPGCGLIMPRGASREKHAYFNASPECWSVYTEVLAVEYSDGAVFGVDAYAVQHAGGMHPDKSVGVHLCGLYLAIERGVRPMNIPPLFQQLVSVATAWPTFTLPEEAYASTVFDVALAGGGAEHLAAVRAWSSGVWRAWARHHTSIAALVAEHLGAHTA
jgi:hypothetical protein